MFRKSYQKGCFSVFYSLGSNPLQNWSLQVENGHAKRIHDEDIESMAFEILGCNVSTTFITAPKDPKISLGIKLPFLVLLVKNISKYFTFEVKILDDANLTRRFRISTFQRKTIVKTFGTYMPLGMASGWNQLYLNLAEFTRRAYGTTYMETVRLQINANVRLRRIYFSDRLYTEDNIPNDFRLKPIPKERRNMDYKTPKARPPSPASTTTEEASGKSRRVTIKDAAGKTSMVTAKEPPARSPSTLQVPRGSAVANGAAGKRKSRKSTSKGGSRTSTVTAAERPSRSPSSLQVPRKSAVANGAAGKRKSRKSTSKGASKASMVTAADPPAVSPALLAVPRASTANVVRVSEGGESRKSTAKDDARKVPIVAVTGPTAESSAPLEIPRQSIANVRVSKAAVIPVESPKNP